MTKEEKQKKQIENLKSRVKNMRSELKEIVRILKGNEIRHFLNDLLHDDEHQANLDKIEESK